jgi:uncharacterized membrane protein
MAGLASRVKRGAQDLTGQAGDAAQGVKETAGGAVDGGRRSDSLRGELTDEFREAAVEVLKPVMRKATLMAAKYAVTKGPDLVKGRLDQAGGAGALAKGLSSKGGGVAEAVGGLASGIGGKLGGGGKKEGGESPSGTGRGRRLPVQEFVDVGVDLQTAYDQFTQFEDWPKFMHRVERIEQRDETTLMWHENIWGVRRSWEAKITDQQPCERIAWRSNGGTQTIGVVTFHKLSDNLTRVAITMDFQPKGLFEKTASGTRISRRALRSDLMRFKAFVELRDEATGEWRGRIEDGELVEPEDEQQDDAEGREEEEPQASEEDDEESEEDDEPVAEEDDDEPVAEEDDEEPAAEEDDEEPVAEEDDDEPVAGEDEDYEDDEDDEDEEPSAEEEDDEPAAEEDEDVAMEDDDEEPSAEEDEDEQPSGRRGRFSREEEQSEEEPAEPPRPRRRGRRATASSGGDGR